MFYAVFLFKLLSNLCLSCTKYVYVILLMFSHFHLTMAFRENQPNALKKLHKLYLLVL